jgi:hypothetical protein
VHVDLPKQPINQFKSVRLKEQQALKAYCPNIYYVYSVSFSFFIFLWRKMSCQKSVTFISVDLLFCNLDSDFLVSGSRNLVREIWFKESGSRNLVREKWFCKLVFFPVQEKWLTRKKVDLYYKSRTPPCINPPFFRLEKSGSANSDFFSSLRKVVDQKKKSEFAEPLF